MKRIVFLILVTVILFIFTGCSEKSAEAVSVKDAWARPGIVAGNSAVYFTITNGSDAADSLLSAETNVAGKVELHMSKMDSSGMMVMQPQSSVTIPAKDRVEFKPGGLHVMLINLTNELKSGDEIELKLNFQNAGSVSLKIPVKQP